MSFLTIGALFLAIAYAAWQNGSHLAYIMAWFVGAGALAYTVGNGLKEAWLIWAFTAGLILVGFLRDRLKSD
jgi:hypothetical protein